MEMLRIVVAVVLVVGFLLHQPALRWYRAKRYARGRKLNSKPDGKKPNSTVRSKSLRWGNNWLPWSAATQHFLAVGTTGSGKSQVQRLLLREPLRAITDGSDSRALIFDAKGDTTAYLKRIGVTCPVYSLNPFESRDSVPIAVSWDIAKDITSPARALNLVASLFPQEKSGNNQYFSDAARMVVTSIVESFIRHSCDRWTFSDLVYTSLSKERIQAVLERDALGRETLDAFFGDERTGYAVFTTVVSKMRYYAPIAALWQRSNRRLSIREWLSDDSILLLGSNATAKASLDALNGQIFKVMTEEIDAQTNSSTRRTFVWLDEARLAGSLLKSELLPFLAVKGRSRGAALVISFQDMEGFREAAGPRIANEIVAQCSNKALLRQESDESSQWASKVLGQTEVLEGFRSNSSNGLGLASMGQNISEQRVVKDAVLASEFYGLPVTSKENGLTGYFVTATSGASRSVISPDDIEHVVVGEREEKRDAIQYRPETDQWIKEWTVEDRERLLLPVFDIKGSEESEQEPRRKLRLGKRPASMEHLQLPNALNG